jgi:osmoprotectant transport system permease protein
MDLLWSYLTDAGNWSGRTGIGHRLLEHIGFTVTALLIAALVALPLGVAIGHSRRGSDLAIMIGGTGRAVPALGLLAYLVLKTDNSDGPILVVLAVLGVPAMLAASYGGVRRVNRHVVESARAAGMQPHQVLTQVEIPAALPTILAGIRASACQVVAATTLAAYVGGGGLGRLIVDGLAVRQYGVMATGAVLVAAVALVLDLALRGAERAVVSPGVSGRYPVGPPARPAAAGADLASVTEPGRG